MQVMPSAQDLGVWPNKRQPAHGYGKVRWAGMTDLNLFILEFSIIFPDRPGCKNTNRQFFFILTGNNVLEP